MNSNKLHFPPLFTKDTDGKDPLQSLDTVKVDCIIKGPDGSTVFEQKNVEAPKDWSSMAVNVVASKYFYGAQGTEEREGSVPVMIARVVDFIKSEGSRQGYFNTDGDATVFRNDLAWLLAHQRGSFNSPVWFNCGLVGRTDVSSSSSGFHWNLNELAVSPTTGDSSQYPQCSACFIQSVADDMDSIMALAVSEARLFKHGSGTGTDLSAIRASCETLAGGGSPSGPMSFLQVYDKIAGIVKSGGKTRRAAKLNSLRVDHPDILEFVEAKGREEKKAHALIDSGYDGSFNGEAYSTVAFQNANLSVRVSDEFMRAVEAGGRLRTRWVTDPDKYGPEYPAKEILDKIAESAHLCGDPGLQFDDTTNHWHTCKESGRINASNPCGEFCFLDDSACNLASLNLLKFVDYRDGAPYFKTGEFIHAVRLFITAQDILVDASSYPTVQITQNSHDFRPLGLGYANLGAMLMSLGVAYDSVEGRSLASAITGLMQMAALGMSQTLGTKMGAFQRWEKNKDHMGEAVNMHIGAVNKLAGHDGMLGDISACARALSRDLCSYKAYRNAQVTVLAPTGTISFMMDCATTGIEPEIALVKYKLMASHKKGAEGGHIKMANTSVKAGLAALGYQVDETYAILEYIRNNDTIEGSPHISEEHLRVFDCAFKAAKGTRILAPEAHLSMMAAVQPFLSGAISKTVNLPSDATPADVAALYIRAWKWGLKSVTAYRDGSKRSQPLTVSKTNKPATVKGLIRENRERLPSVRDALTHKFDIGPHEGYVTLGFYPDGRLGEMFVTMAKEGSTIRGLMDCWATSISIGLQYGVPFDVYKDKFAHTRFEPAGFCNGGSVIKSCSSLPDYIFRWVDLYLKGVAAPDKQKGGVSEPVEEVAVETGVAGISAANRALSSDAPPCPDCGAITVRNGTCFKCVNCGNSLGCS